jgi:hypothetical protein
MLALGDGTRDGNVVWDDGDNDWVNDTKVPCRELAEVEPERPPPRRREVGFRLTVAGIDSGTPEEND